MTGKTMTGKIGKRSGNSIIITGTPGTGKTTISKKLSLLLKKDPEFKGKTGKNGIKMIHLSRFVRDEGLIDDRDEVDPGKMAKVLSESLNGPLDGSVASGTPIHIVDGHMSHFLAKKHAKLCIVCRTDLKKLKRRLKKRGYSEEKIRNNLESEIFEVCKTEAMEKRHDIFEIDTSDSRKVGKQLREALRMYFS